MNCTKIMNMIYEDEPMSFSGQIQMGIHTFFCSACAHEIENYQAARTIMKDDFFRSSPNIEDTIMAKLQFEQTEEEQGEYSYANPGGISTRGWVIAGFVLMISLVTAFFGFDFKNLVSEYGMSFILPMGITIGIALTIYCALFIGSHLKELSERFGL